MQAPLFFDNNLCCYIPILYNMNKINSCLNFCYEFHKIILSYI